MHVFKCVGLSNKLDIISRNGSGDCNAQNTLINSYPII